MRTRSLSLLPYEAVVVVHLLHALHLAWAIAYHMHVVTRLNLESCGSKKHAMMEDATVELLTIPTVDQMASQSDL